MDLKEGLGRGWAVPGCALIAAGVVSVCVGYAGVSGSRYDVGGLSYLLSGGVGGLLLMGFGVTLLVCADLGAEARGLDRVEEAIRAEGRSSPAQLNETPPTGPPVANEQRTARDFVSGTSR